MEDCDLRHFPQIRQKIVIFWIYKFLDMIFHLSLKILEKKIYRWSTLYNAGGSPDGSSSKFLVLKGMRFQETNIGAVIYYLGTFIL
jgi:hypothetical protein